MTESDPIWVLLSGPVSDAGRADRPGPVPEARRRDHARDARERRGARLHVPSRLVRRGRNRVLCHCPLGDTGRRQRLLRSSGRSTTSRVRSRSASRATPGSWPSAGVGLRLAFDRRPIRWLESGQVQGRRLAAAHARRDEDRRADRGNHRDPGVIPGETDLQRERLDRRGARTNCSRTRQARAGCPPRPETPPASPERCRMTRTAPLASVILPVSSSGQRAARRRIDEAEDDDGSSRSRGRVPRIAGDGELHPAAPGDAGRLKPTDLRWPIGSSPVPVPTRRTSQPAGRPRDERGDEADRHEPRPSRP